MTAEQIAELLAALSAAAQPAEPEFMTVSEYVAYLRLDAEDVKDPERWVRDRLMPSHPEFLQHHRFGRNHPVFSRDDRATNSARYRKPVAASADAPSAPGDTRALGFDPNVIKRGGRALGIVPAHA